MIELLTAYAVALGLVAGMGVIWAAVQQAWRRQCGVGSTDTDGLAGRASCLGCVGADHCTREPREEVA